MAKFGFDCSNDIKRFQSHKTGVKRAMIRAGKETVKEAQREIRQAAPVETGALQTAVYVQTRELNGTVSGDYESNVVEAAGKNMDIENEGKALDRVELPPAGEAGSVSGVGIAVSYADPIIEGYHNVLTDRAVPPNDFFHPACEVVESRYPARAQTELDKEAKKLEQ